MRKVFEDNKKIVEYWVINTHVRLQMYLVGACFKRVQIYQVLASKEKKSCRGNTYLFHYVVFALFEIWYLLQKLLIWSIFRSANFEDFFVIFWLLINKFKTD